ncbi:MAG: CHAP domain-containing protein [Lacrimispora sp.]
MKYNVIEKVSKEFEKWIDYCEKEKLSAIGIDYDNPEAYAAGAGDNNYTIFAKVYKEKTGIDVQGQPWCDSFVDTIYIHLFGVEMAKKLLGGFSAYTPTSAQYFKNINRWATGTPEEGYVGFFQNSERIYHTFYVRDFKNGTTMVTIEGNTSGLTGIVENGGCVAQKSYAYSSYKSKIPGFGTPDYSLVEKYTEGWIKAADNVRWWYQRKDGSYPANKWCIINHHYYLFDRNGYMVTGWHRWDGKVCDPDDGSGDWFFLDNTKDGPLEGACWHSRENGAQEIWRVDGVDDI